MLPNHQSGTDRRHADQPTLVFRCHPGRIRPIWSGVLPWERDFLIDSVSSISPAARTIRSNGRFSPVHNGRQLFRKLNIGSRLLRGE